MQNKPVADISEINKYRNGFRFDTYMREHLYMVSGEIVQVTMKLLKKNIGDFIDWYGKEFRIMKHEPEEITIQFPANDTALRYWALQYGQRATIISPESVRKKMEKEVKFLAEKYL